jgi:hypothetical protein
MPSSPPFNADEIKTLFMLRIRGFPLCFGTHIILYVAFASHNYSIRATPHIGIYIQDTAPLPSREKLNERILSTVALGTEIFLITAL